MFNILMTTNESYAQHCGVCITSLVENNPDSQFNIVIAGLGLSNLTKNKIIECGSLNDNVKINVIDFNHDKIKSLPETSMYTKDIYLRLWVDDFFDLEVETVLYIDVDAIVVDSISDLFNQELEEYVIAAVDIPFAECEEHCPLPPEFNYFNSGVLLFNLKRWRDEKYRSQIVNYILDNSKSIEYPDQDALNGVLFNKRLKLDYTYNVIGPFFRKNTYEKLGKNEIKRIREQAKIVHFNGVGAKPWFYTSNHPYQKKYFSYLSRTPWQDYRPVDKTFLNFVKKYLRIILNVESFVRVSFVKGS